MSGIIVEFAVDEDAEMRYGTKSQGQLEFCAVGEGHLRTCKSQEKNKVKRT